MSIIPPTDGTVTTTEHGRGFSLRNLADIPPAKISPQQADEMHLDSLPDAHNFGVASTAMNINKSELAKKINLPGGDKLNFSGAEDLTIRYIDQKLKYGTPILDEVEKTIMERKSKLVADKYGIPDSRQVLKHMQIDFTEEWNLTKQNGDDYKAIENRMRYVVIEPPGEPNKRISCPIIKIAEADYAVDESGFLYKAYNPTGGTVYDGSVVRMNLMPTRELVLDKSTKGSLPKIEGRTDQIDFLTQHDLAKGLDGSKGIAPEFLQFKPDKEIGGFKVGIFSGDLQELDRPDKTRVSKEYPIQPATKGFNNRIISAGPGAIDGIGGFKGLLRKLAPPPVTTK